jgi:hypothetical protein
MREARCRTVSTRGVDIISPGGHRCRMVSTVSKASRFRLHGSGGYTRNVVERFNLDYIDNSRGRGGSGGQPTRCRHRRHRRQREAPGLLLSTPRVDSGRLLSTPTAGGPVAALCLWPTPASPTSRVRCDADRAIGEQRRHTTPRTEAGRVFRFGSALPRTPTPEDWANRSTIVPRPRGGDAVTSNAPSTCVVGCDEEAQALVVAPVFITVKNVARVSQPGCYPAFPMNTGGSP